MSAYRYSKVSSKLWTCSIQMRLPRLQTQRRSCLETYWQPRQILHQEKCPCHRGPKTDRHTSLEESSDTVHIFVSVSVTIQHAFHHFCKCFFAGPSTRGLHFADGGTKDKLLTDLDNSLQAVEYGEENVSCVMFAAGLYLLDKCLIEQIWHEFAA
jgi:hypothetical protein